MKKFQKMINKVSILVLLFTVFLSLPVLAQENSGNISIEQLDTDTKEPVSGVKLALYKVADTEANGSYELTADFQQIGVDASTFCDSEKYNENIQLIDKYIEENKPASVSTKTSESDGMINYTGLSDGIYFVRQANTAEDFEKLGYSYETESYLLVLPWTDENGNFTRTIHCKPKGKVIYQEEKKNIVVYKIWKDNSDKNGSRPSGITVGLYCENQLQEKVTLNAENNWTYQWRGLNAKKVWKVKELDVPEGYSSEVTAEGNTYTITNKWTPPETPPTTPPDKSKKSHSSTKTGDYNHIMFYVILLIGSSVLLLGRWFFRRKE